MERFSEIITGLGIPAKIEQEIRGSIDAILTNGLSIDEKLENLKAIGEDGSAKIVSAYLNLIGLEATYVNPQEAGLFVSNEPGNAQILPESFAKIYSLREREGILVIPGFFGYTTDGKLMTFSRGGSDITGSIEIGRASCREKIERLV